MLLLWLITLILGIRLRINRLLDGNIHGHLSIYYDLVCLNVFRMDNFNESFIVGDPGPAAAAQKEHI